MLKISPQVVSITGTANQITASSPSGAVTLSTPQNIDTAAAVEFATLSLISGKTFIDPSAADATGSKYLTLNTVNTITATGWASSAGFTWLSMESNGTQRGRIDWGAGNSLRFYATGRMDFETAGAQYFTSTALYFQSPASINRTGDATSTATQKPSDSLSFQNSVWNGSVASKMLHYVKNLASTATNLASQLIFVVNTTSSVGTGGTEAMRMLHTAEVKIGSTDETVRARLEVDQPNASAAVPVLYLDQADVSEEMIEFNTTIGTGNAIEAIGGKTLTTTHFIKVTIPGGLTRYIPVGTIA